MMGKRIEWNPRNWEPWEQALLAVIASLVFLSLVVALLHLGLLRDFDRWLSTPEGQVATQAFGVVALVFAIITSAVGVFYVWLYPFLLDRRERERERIRDEVRQALSADWPLQRRSEARRPDGFGPPPGTFSATCDAPGCFNYSWAREEEEFLERTSPQGHSTVKLTTSGFWACKEHASNLGGWRS